MLLNTWHGTRFPQRFSALLYSSQVCCYWATTLHNSSELLQLHFQLRLFQESRRSLTSIYLCRLFICAAKLRLSPKIWEMRISGHIQKFKHTHTENSRRFWDRGRIVHNHKDGPHTLARYIHTHIRTKAGHSLAPGCIF